MTDEEKNLAVEVERALRFNGHSIATIVSQGYCPNLCRTRLKEEPELDGEHMNFTCPTCRFHSRISHIVVERAHDVILDPELEEQ